MIFIALFMAQAVSSQDLAGNHEYHYLDCPVSVECGSCSAILKTQRAIAVFGQWGGQLW